MSDEESNPRREELQGVFKLFDANGDGSIDKKELANGMRALGGNPTEADIQMMMQEADSQSNPNGKIEFNEFCDLMMAHVKSKGEEEESLRQAFKAFDRNGDGRIDEKELRIALTKIGLGQLTEDEVDELFKQADKDNSGYIEYNELITVMTGAGN